MQKRQIDAAARWAKRPNNLLILLALTVSFGVVVYAAVTNELGSAVLFSTLVTIAIFIVWLLLRLQKVEVQRDRALAWSRESEWRASQQKIFQISQTGPESAMHLQQLLDLQREIAAMRAREAVLEKQAYYDELTKLPNGKTVDVGASLGKAVYPRDGSDLSALLAVADRAMYQSKANRLAQYY